MLLDELVALHDHQRQEGDAVLLGDGDPVRFRGCRQREQRRERSN